MEQEFWIVVVGATCLFVVMPAIISVSSYMEKKLKLQREQLKSGGEELRAQLAATLIELEQMRERMAVMERLVTDDDRRLSNEIERLRRENVRNGA